MHENRRKHVKVSGASTRKRGVARQDSAPAQDVRGDRGIRAGDALLRAATGNPEAYPGVFRMLRLKQHMMENPELADALRAIWAPVRQAQEDIRAATAKLMKPLKIVSAASVSLQPVMTAICAEYQSQLAAIWADIREVSKAEFEKLLDDIREAESQADKEWASKFPCSRPRTTEDWQRLAVRAGFSGDFAMKGEWTPADILPIVEGYFQRLQDRPPCDADDSVGKSSRATAEAVPDDDGCPFFKPAHFKKYNIGDELLRRNATISKRYVMGKVRRINKQTSKGKKAVYWYSEPDARKQWPHKFPPVDTPPSRP